jgi:hypothetical protein
MVGLIQQGKFVEALQRYKQLPEALRGLKSMQLMRINAAGNLSDREHDEAIEDFRKSFPADPCLDIMLIDSYRIHNQTALALKSIDKVEQSFGPDPYLSFIRARFYLNDRRYDEAIAAGRKAVQSEPELEAAYWIQVQALLGQQNYGEVVRLLRVMKDERRVSIARVRRLPGYSELASSPAYVAWAKERGPAIVPLPSNGNDSHRLPERGDHPDNDAQATSPYQHEMRFFLSRIKPETSETLPAKLELSKATEAGFKITCLDFKQDLRSGICSWSPAGDRLLLADSDNQLAEISTNDWMLRRRLPPIPVHSVVWLDKSLLISAFGQPGIWNVSDLAPDTLIGRRACQFTKVANACVSRQPPRLFLADSRGEAITVVDAQSRKILFTASRAKLAKDRGLTADHVASGPTNLSVTPDAKSLLYVDRNKLECYDVEDDKLVLKQTVARPVELRSIVTGIEAGGFAALVEQKAADAPRQDWHFYLMSDLTHHVAEADAESGCAVPAIVPKSGEILTMNAKGFAVRDAQGNVAQSLPWTLMAKTIRAGGTTPGFTTSSLAVARIYAHPQGKGALIVTQQWALWIEWEREKASAKAK